MKTIEMQIDEPLLSRIDHAVEELKVSRSQFFADALLLALEQLQTLKSEREHERGYALHPVQPDEFNGWEDEQVWGDA